MFIGSNQAQARGLLKIGVECELVMEMVNGCPERLLVQRFHIVYYLSNTLKQNRKLPKSRVKRRLAAILAADVVGYSLHISANETDTVARLATLRLKIIEPGITKHSGRLFKTMGDGFLVEFSSAVQAVNCAIAIQNEIGHTVKAPDEKSKMQLRIGIHVGDVLVEGDDLMGDGVNIAARLESIAETGGIFISRTVHDQVRDRIEVGCIDKGEIKLKNIPRPIQVFALSGLKKSVSKAAHFITALKLPDKPSIAVLPFDNMSREPEQEYLSDGIVEDIITDLSRFKSLFVIARNSSFSYKGKPIKIQDVGRDLGVRYVVQGSIRRSAGRIRITAQLIDAFDESNLWGERYDRELHDIFSVQDEIVETIVGMLIARVERHSLESVKRTDPQDLKAYDYILQARRVICDSAESNRRCRELYESVLLIDPYNVDACCGMSITHGLDYHSGWSESPEWSFEQSVHYALKAVELDDDNSQGHCRLGFQRLLQRKYDLAEHHLDKALALNPNDSSAWAYKGLYYIYIGQPEHAKPALEQATRRNPFHYTWYLWFVGLMHYSLREYQEAIPALQRSIDHGPNFIAPRRHLAACYAQLNKIEDAAVQTAMILELDPNFSIKKLSKTLSYRDPADLEHYLDGLRKAGLPD